MLETIRAFALEDLAASREEPVLRRAHAAWAEAFARNADNHFWTSESAEWLERSERELDNYRSAMSWAIANDATHLGLRLPETLWRLWRTRGLYAEGRTWISRALEASPDASPELRALALEGLGNLAWKQGDLLVAAAAYEESLATWQAAGKLARSGGATDIPRHHRRVAGRYSPGNLAPGTSGRHWARGGRSSSPCGCPQQSWNGSANRGRT